MVAKRSLRTVILLLISHYIKYSWCICPRWRRPPMISTRRHQVPPWWKWHKTLMITVPARQFATWCIWVRFLNFGEERIMVNQAGLGTLPILAKIYPSALGQYSSPVGMCPSNLGTHPTLVWHMLNLGQTQPQLGQSQVDVPHPPKLMQN